MSKYDRLLDFGDRAYRIAMPLTLTLAILALTFCVAALLIGGGES